MLNHKLLIFFGILATNFIHSAEKKVRFQTPLEVPTKTTSSPDTEKAFTEILNEIDKLKTKQQESATSAESNHVSGLEFSGKIASAAIAYGTGILLRQHLQKQYGQTIDKYYQNILSNTFMEKWSQHASHGLIQIVIHAYITSTANILSQASTITTKHYKKYGTKNKLGLTQDFIKKFHLFKPTLYNCLAAPPSLILDGLKLITLNFIIERFIKKDSNLLRKYGLDFCLFGRSIFSAFDLKD